MTFLLAAALAAGAPAPAAAQLPLPAAKLAAVEAAIAAEMSRLNIPGLSAALVLDHELRWSAGFGRADVENNVPATASTVYRLGSIAKTITATAALQLAEKGRLDLDAPVQRYVPSFPVKPWPVTCRQLLAHTAGIRWYAGDEMESTRHYANVADALALFSDDPLAFEPGTAFLYSSYGYNLLGAAIEGASGMSYLDYVRKHVFEPAGLERAQADDVLALIPNRARGYQRASTGELRNSVLADTSNKVPGGGLVATAEDVARFAMALQGGVLLQKETIARMMTRQATRDGKLTGTGLGLFLAERDGVREAWHTGGQPQVSTVLYMQPDRRVAVAVLTNLEGIGPVLLDLARQIGSIAMR
ncbi:MAG TPA: serine hydrolase domain-containing protein [Vicinamibacteria bacterium]|nr:serine hydrolase domain-containing protein [Vicinamibacteria bacterium]